MKKMIALGMAAMMCLSMTACSVSTSSKTETTAAATEAAETTAEAAKDSETTAEAAGDLVATADYPTKPITMIILTVQAEQPIPGAESLQFCLKNI